MFPRFGILMREEWYRRHGVEVPELMSNNLARLVRGTLNALTSCADQIAIGQAGRIVLKPRAPNCRADP